MFSSVVSTLALPLNAFHPAGVFLAIAFAFGCCLGSFFNVCIWRIPLGESIVVVASHCPKCNHPIRWFDNVPIIAWLALRGRCRDCGAPISPRYILVEFFTGVIFTALVLNAACAGLPLSVTVFCTIILAVIIPCAFIDVEFRKLPDKLTVFGMIAGVLYHWAFDGNAPMALLTALGWTLGALAGVGLFAWLTKRLFKRTTLGGGDVKYSGFLGAAFGAGLLPVLCFGCFLAIGGYTLCRVFGKKKPADGTVAFGLYLGIAALAWSFLAPWLLHCFNIAL